MAFLLIILLIVILIVGALLVAGLFTRKQMTASRSVVINRPVAEVFGFVRLLKNQDLFSKWASMDPNMKKSFQGEDGTVGAVSSWQSQMKNVGAGEQEITGIAVNQYIDYALRFLWPFKSTANVRLATEAVDANATRVIWSFDSKMDYPMNLMLLFKDMEKGIGDDFQTGLDTLKSVLEK